MKSSWKRVGVVAALVCATASGVVGAQAQTAAGGIVALPEVVVSATPLPSSEGGGIEINKVPGDVSIVTSKDFIQQYSPSVTTAITSHVPARSHSASTARDLSPDLFYRGFDASRISGTSAGLAVYENGVRINENFGDSVNLDLIPPIALASSEIYTNNPIFGLNALGGAINFTTKNGFNFHGGDVTLLGGSYGRANGFGEFGKQVRQLQLLFRGRRLSRRRLPSVRRAERPALPRRPRLPQRRIPRRSPHRAVRPLAARRAGHDAAGAGAASSTIPSSRRRRPRTTRPARRSCSAASTSPRTGRSAAASTSASSTSTHVDGNDADVTDCGEIDGNNAGTLCQQPLVGNQNSNQLQFRTANGGTIPSMGANTDAFPGLRHDRADLDPHDQLRHADPGDQQGQVLRARQLLRRRRQRRHRQHQLHVADGARPAQQQFPRHPVRLPRRRQTSTPPPTSA